MINLMSNREVRKVLNEVGDRIENLENVIQVLRAENQALKDEHYKDEELARLKEANNEIWEEYLNSFSLSDTDKEKLNQLFEEHCLQHPDETNSLGNNECKIVKYPRHRIASYEFFPTEIDIFIKVKCSCGEVFDIR